VEDTGWEMGPLDYTELEEAGESWGPGGKFLTPFLIAQVGSRQAVDGGEEKDCTATA